MAIDRLPNLPSGADVFLDANVFIYALSGKLERVPRAIASLFNRRKEPDHRKRVIFRPDLEIAVGYGGWISSFILQPLSFQVPPAAFDLPG